MNSRDNEVDIKILLQDINIASIAMQQRMNKFNIELDTTISLNINGKEITLYSSAVSAQKLMCKLDNRLLRRILDRQSHWNNAEIGCHIEFLRTPNVYEPDAHTALQFFHI